MPIKRRALSSALVLRVGIAACGVIAGSLGERTSRTYDPGPGQTVQTDGGYRWAIWTLLCGVVALGGAIAWTVAPRWRPALGAVLAGAFLGAAMLCGNYWLRLRDGHDFEYGFVLNIGSGVKTVTIAGLIGWLFALRLSATGLRARASPDETG